MTCRPIASLSLAAGALGVLAMMPRVSSAQQPPATVAPYRAPVIALVQPPMGASGSGGTVPLDRPAVVFRFAAGEPDDPLDLGSLLVAIDGVDRTALFQATATQAWGPLADEETLRRGAFAAGPHRVAARVCSSRGACTTAEAQVLVQPGPIAVTATTLEAPQVGKRSTTRRVLDTAVGVVRKLLSP